MAKKTNIKKQKKQIKRTVQQTLPYIEGYENGVIQIEPSRFSRTVELEDISFKTKSDEEQNVIFEQYSKLLNAINPGEDLFLSFINTKGNTAETLNPLLSQTNGDEYDHYRNELSNMVKDKMLSGRKNIKTRKVATMIVDSPSVEDAFAKLNIIEANFSSDYRKITKTTPTVLDLSNRLELLDQILNGGDRINPWFERSKNGNISVNFKAMRQQNLTTKDIIAPDVLKFNGNNFQIGERWGKVFYLDKIANWLNTNFLAELSELNFESCITLHIQAVPSEEAFKKIHNKSVSINAEINNKEHISKKLQNVAEQLDDWQEDLANRDQKMFYTNLTMVIFADDKEELKTEEIELARVYNKHNCRLSPLLMMQERGLCATLPLGIDKTFSKRPLTTESLSVFLPFDEINTLDAGGFYYGTNSINKSLIIYNRKKGMNYNGLIFGSPGSGKSLSAKREISNAFLNTPDNIIVIDPDEEYLELAKAYHGSIVKLSPGNGVYINPFDLDIDTSFDPDLNPITMKMDFICGMMETMLGGNVTLSPSQKAIVNRCTQTIYKPYLQHLAELPPNKDGSKRTIDRDYCPTMQSFFNALLSQPQPEAQNMALIMEQYTVGDYDTFAHRTNVDLDNRFIVYDIGNVGGVLKELALKVCTNDTWVKIAENRRKNKWTWFYVDEFHLLMSNYSTASFLKDMWKRARKYYGIPTGITQNVEDVLQSSFARTIINTTSFVYMMNQSKLDRDALETLIGLSNNDMEYITNADPGCGLIYTGKQVIPFTDKFPEDTELFKLLTTKPKE